MVVLTPLIAQADVLGRFQNTENYPGFIDFTGKSKAFKNDKATYKKLKELAKDYDIEIRTPSEILVEDFIDSEGLIIKTAFNSRLKRLSDIEKIIYETELKKEIESKSKKNKDDFDIEKTAAKFEKDWKKSKDSVQFNYVRDAFKKALQLAETINISKANESDLNSDVQTFLAHLFNGLEVLQSIRLSDYGSLQKDSLVKFIMKMKGIFKQYKITKKRLEASNVLVPTGLPAGIPKEFQEKLAKQTFFSEADLKSLSKEYGVDISKFDPPSSGLWRNPKGKIQSYVTLDKNASANKSTNIGAYNGQGFENLAHHFYDKKLEKNSTEDIAKLESIAFTKDFMNREKIVSVVFKDVNSGGTTQKFNVQIKTNADNVLKRNGN